MICFFPIFSCSPILLENRRAWASSSFCLAIRPTRKDEYLLHQLINMSCLFGSLASVWDRLYGLISFCSFAFIAAFFLLRCFKTQTCTFNECVGRNRAFACCYSDKAFRLYGWDLTYGLSSFMDDLKEARLTPPEHRTLSAFSKLHLYQRLYTCKFIWT